MARNLSTSQTSLLGLLVTGLLVLLAALVAPIATLDQLFLDPDTYSIIGSIVNLWSRGDYLLMVLIAAFSVIFPVFKYLMLMRIVLANDEQCRADSNLGVLRFLGKWSMLDVFVTVISFGAANLGVLSQVEIHWGIYLYAAGVIVSMCVAMRLSWERCSRRALAQNQAGNFGFPGSGLLLLAFACFAIGLAMPLIEIEKWLFWESHYSLLSALRHLLGNGEYLLPVLLTVFVVLLPLARFIVSALVRWQDSPGQGLYMLDEFLEEWAMFDVYMLAMLLVVIKLSDSAAVTLLPGFWLLLTAAVVGFLESVRQRLGEATT